MGSIFYYTFFKESIYSAFKIVILAKKVAHFPLVSTPPLAFFLEKLPFLNGCINMRILVIINVFVSLFMIFSKCQSKVAVKNPRCLPQPRKSFSSELCEEVLKDNQDTLEIIISSLNIKIKF